MDDDRTQALTIDPNRTQLGAPPSAFDPNRTVIGNVTAGELTVTLVPRQCPVCRTFNPAGHIYCVSCGLIFADAPEGDAFAAPTVKLPRLIESGGREHFLRDGEMCIGREGDIPLPDPRVSRRHARLIVSGAEVLLEDVGSTNGTMRNSTSLT
ncbi:MAG: hypothetical protein C4320_03390, partial [Armatimonadota bacterium]